MLPSFSSRRRALIGLVAAAVCLPLAAALPASVEAHPPADDPRPPRSTYDVVLEDDAGRPLRAFWHRGQQFALGELGERYAVRITNRSPHRVEAVLTVDGRDAISGRRGDYVRQRGYLIGPYDSIVVRGFRRSLSEVATFRFTDPGDSYSARMGSPENVGIIGVAFFPEARRAPRRPVPLSEEHWAPRPDHRSAPHRKNPNPRAGRSANDSSSAKPPARSRSSRTADGADSAPRRQHAPRAAERSEVPRDDALGGRRDNLGTRYGEARTSHVTEVPFERRHPRHPSSVVTIRYDDAEGLEARGIVVEPRWHARWRPHHPVAFPESRFAPPPP